MSSFWESKYLNSEKSIQFLQATHAEVLTGLHEEIDSLQKQCSDYALKLSMRATTALEKEEFDQKFKSFNTEYKRKDALIQEQKKLIDERNKNLKSLQERVKQLEIKLEDESSNKDLIIKQLKQQLESQSDQIAMLTYQLHQINKSNKQQQIIENPTGPVISARKKQFILNKPTQSLIYESNSIDKSLIEYDSAYINSKNHRKHSAYSTKSDQYSISDEQYPAGAACSLDTTKQQLINNQRLSSSSSHNSAAAAAAAPNSTDRSLTPTIHSSTKILPPVVKRLSENVPPPDPKPFLQSAASTLHSRNKNHNSNNNNKELIQRRTLISLPPINKSFEVNHLIVVESPHKQNNNQNKIEHNNSSAN